MSQDCMKQYIETVYDTAFGKRISQKIMVTPKGQVYLANKLKKEF